LRSSAEVEVFTTESDVDGDITLCNVVGSFDPLEGGADCTVEGVFVLDRLAASFNVTAENACKPQVFASGGILRVRFRFKR